MRIIDRYLEHCRILYFYRAGEELVFISSADWMPRNLDRRAELLIPVEYSTNRHRLIDILRSYQQDNVKGRLLLSTGGFEHPRSSTPKAPYRHQQYQYMSACRVEREADQFRRTTFQPHRAPDNSQVSLAADAQAKPKEIVK